MTDKIAELTTVLSQDDPASWVANLWTTFNNQRRVWIEETKEVRDYIFATDTSKTSNSSLPWKNTTTLPKLCQIRDNLHANYLSSLFPNEDWLQWQGFTQDDNLKTKAEAIEGYMKNKTRESQFRTEASKLLLDYIDTGNVFATVDYEANYVEREDGEVIPEYVGPRARRISPNDVVFNPLASSFRDSWKIVRSVKTIGEIKKLMETHPEQAFWRDAMIRRELIQNHAGSHSIEDFDKATGYSIDGFGSLYEYYQSNYVEILEFYGDYHDQTSGELHTNRILTVVDRSVTVRDAEIPSWLGHAPIYHVGWRFRPDNLWAMSPLANLVGIQYRIDHLQNAKADAIDLTIQPPLKIIGEVEEFHWGPSSEIHIDENGDVGEVSRNLGGVITAQSEVQELMDFMELFAGAPREAMGVRTPGEKTAFEVQQLQNAAGRIFQEKITTFEVELLEPLMNAMLETARRNLDGSDIIRVQDDDLGVEAFLTVTKEDITAAGKIRPVGARHFAEQARVLQDLVGIFNSPLAQVLAPHTSGKNLAKTVEAVLNLENFGIFEPNVAFKENAESQREQASLQEQAIMEEGVEGL